MPHHQGMAAPTTYYARFAPVPLRLRKGRADTRALTVESVLSAPYPDHAGDIVEPQGLDFSPHAAEPGIDLEHGRDPYIKGRPVAWARPTLSRPGDYHHPRPTRLNFGTDERPEWHTVPVATEWFDPKDRVSSQVFALCEQDALPGRSLEFTPVQKAFDKIGWSDLENRPAYRFRKASVLRWTVCARPVCEYAQQVSDSFSKSIPGGVPPQLSKVIRDRRVLVGGTWEPLCPVLVKALSPYAPAPTNRTTVRVEKAMEDDEVMGDDGMGADATVSALEEDAPAGEMADAPPSNGVTAMYAHVDAVQAAIDQLETDLQASDNPKIIGDAMKMAEQMKALLAKIKATADKHDAALTAALSGEGAEEEAAEDEAGDEYESDGGEAEEAEEAEDDEEFVAKALARDTDGVLTNVRPVYKKAIRAKRFSKADVAAGQSQPDAAEVAELKEALAALKKQLKYAR